MLNNDRIKQHASSAKLEIELSAKHLESGFYDVEMVLSMLAEAMKQMNIVIEECCK
jgi:hypothetical protein